MVTFKICTFVYLKVDYRHQENFFWKRIKRSHRPSIKGTRLLFSSIVIKAIIIISISKYLRGGGGHCLEILNCLSRSTKNTYFWEIKISKNSSKILANTFSDLLAILKKNCRLTPANFFHTPTFPFPFPFP